MTLEELIALLEKSEEAKKFIPFVKSLDKSSDVERLTKERNNLRTALKEAEAKAKTADQKLEKVYDHLSIDEEDDIEEALSNIDKNQKVDEKLQKRLEKVEKQLKEKETELTTQIEAERGKRHTALKTTELMKALTVNKAMRPELMVELLAKNIQIGDDDALLFVAADGKEMSVADGVKSFLEANPEFVTNSQNPGGGSSGGGGTEKPAVQFAKSIASNQAESQKTTSDGLGLYFSQN